MPARHISRASGITRLRAAFPLVLLFSQTPSPAKDPAPFPLEDRSGSGNRENSGGPAGGPPPPGVRLETTHTFAGDTEFRGRTYHDSGASSANLTVEGLLPQRGRWSIPLEIKSRNLWMDTVPGVPVPDSIHYMEAGAGLAWRPDDTWMFLFKGGPSFYKLEDIGGNDIGVSGGLMAQWRHSRNWQWFLVASYQSDNEHPVIPFIGFQWRINDRWSLSFPRVELAYKAGDRLKLSAGLDLMFGTTFRTGDTFGTELGMPRFNDALASYSDIGAVAGMSYGFNDSVSLDLRAGYSFGREIEFTDLDEKVKFDAAPYLRMGLKVKF